MAQYGRFEDFEFKVKKIEILDLVGVYEVYGKSTCMAEYTTEKRGISIWRRNI